MAWQGSKRKFEANVFDNYCEESFSYLTITALKLFAICIFTDACSQFQASLVKPSEQQPYVSQAFNQTPSERHMEIKKKKIFHRDPTRKLKQTNNSYYRNSYMEIENKFFVDLNSNT